MTWKKCFSNRRALVMTSTLLCNITLQHKKIRGWLRFTQYSGFSFLCSIFLIESVPLSLGSDNLLRDLKLSSIANSDRHGKSLFVVFTSKVSRTIAAEDVRLIAFINVKMCLPPLTITSHMLNLAHSMTMPRYVFPFLVPHVPLLWKTKRIIRCEALYHESAYAAHELRPC